MKDCLMKEEKTHSPVHKLPGLGSQESGDQENWRFQRSRFEMIIMDMGRYLARDAQNKAKNMGL